MTWDKAFAEVSACPNCQQLGTPANGKLIAVVEGPHGKPAGKYLCASDHEFLRTIFIP